MISARLSDEALKILDEQQAATGKTRTALIEELILSGFPPPAWESAALELEQFLGEQDDDGHRRWSSAVRQQADHIHNAFRLARLLTQLHYGPRAPDHVVACYVGIIAGAMRVNNWR